MFTLKDIVNFANSEDGKKCLDYRVDLQLPVNSCCMKYDIDNLEQIGIDNNRKCLILITDYQLYTDSKWYKGKNAIENGLYYSIFDINKDYYDRLIKFKKSLGEKENK